ncbi:MAG: HAD family phosphatase [archaeon]|nr:HAD family phosphatase [archaeon]
MNTIKAIIFDAGEVFVLNSGQGVFEDMARTCQLSLETVIKATSRLIPAYQRGDLNDETYWNEFQKETGLKVLPIDYIDLWSREFEKNVVIDQEVLGLIEGLTGRGYVIPVLSNTIPPHLKALKSIDVFRPFEPKIFSCEVGCRKPEAEIYRLVLETISLCPEQAVFIDDSAEYVKAARNVGMHGIQYKDLLSLEKELKAVGVLIYTKMR